MLFYNNDSYSNFKDMFRHVKLIKNDIRKIYSQSEIKIKREIKEEFYKIPISEFKKNMIWRYIWDEIPYEKLENLMNIHEENEIKKIR